jgi:hypothetical protein
LWAVAFDLLEAEGTRGIAERPFGAASSDRIVPTRDFFYPASGLRYFFFSNEGLPREASHIHVKGGGRDAKVWLEPEPVIAESYGFTRACAYPTRHHGPLRPDLKGMA